MSNVRMARDYRLMQLNWARTELILDDEYRALSDCELAGQQPKG